MEINEMLKKYVEIQKQEESLKAEKDELNKSIIDYMKSNGVNKFEADGIQVQYIIQEKFKYSDEAALVKMLNDKYGPNNEYVVQKVKTTSFNKVLKDSTTLLESLNTLVVKNSIDTIKVKGE